MVTKLNSDHLPGVRHVAGGGEVGLVKASRGVRQCAQAEQGCQEQFRRVGAHGAERWVSILIPWLMPAICTIL